MKLMDSLGKVRVGSIIAKELVNRMKAMKNADNAISTQCDNDFIKSDNCGGRTHWQLEDQLSGALDWIDEVLKAERNYWTCETNYGNELRFRFKGWEGKPEEDLVKLKRDLLAFIADESQPVHDRDLIEEMSYGFFKFTDFSI